MFAEGDAALPADGMAAIPAQLAARLAQVPDDVLEVLRVAAAAGRTVDDHLLARASELARETLRPRLWIALAAALAMTAGGAYAGFLPGTGRRR